MALKFYNFVDNKVIEESISRLNGTDCAINIFKICYSKEEYLEYLIQENTSNMNLKEGVDVSKLIK